MPGRVNDPRDLEDWIVKIEQRLRQLESRRIDAADGLTQDHATKQMSAKISGDSGNAAAIGEDGGIFAADTITTAADHIPLYVQKYMTGSQNFPTSGADQDITWGGQVTSGLWTTTGTDITIPEAGNYLVAFTWQWQNNAVGKRAIKVYTIAGSVPTTSFMSDSRAASFASELAQSVCQAKDFSAGTVLRCSGFQDSGGALLGGGPYFGDIRGRWTVFKIGDAFSPELVQSTA